MPEQTETRRRPKPKRKVEGNKGSSLVNILIVEDSPEDVRLIQDMLDLVEDAAFSISYTRHLSASLTLLEEREFDLIFLDLVLPDSFGLETFRKVRDRASETPIVILVSTENESLAVEALKAGAEDYLIKGQLDDNILMRSIRYATQRKRAEKDLNRNLAQLSEKVMREAIISNTIRNIYQSINLEDVLDNAVDAISKCVEGLDNVFISFVEGEDADSTLPVNSSAAQGLPQAGAAPTPTPSTIQRARQAVLKAYRGQPEWFIEGMRRIPYPLGAVWKTIIEGSPMYCPDADEGKVKGPAGKEGGPASYVSIPIRLGDKVVGVIVVNSFRKNAFEEGELKLLGTVAREIEIAISNARQAEDLRKSEERFRSLIECTNDWMWETDKDGVFTYVSPKAWDIIGYRAEEIIGKTAFDFMFSDEAKRFAEVLNPYLSARKPFAGLEQTLIHRDRRPVALETGGAPVFDGQGGFQGYRGMARDVTERKKAEEMLSSVARGISAPAGETFFRSLVRHAANVLGADCVFIGELIERSAGRVRTVAVFADGKVADNLEYDLAHTPCKNVAGKDTCSYPGGVQEKFPRDSRLKEMNAQGYVGTPILDSSGRALGVLAAMYRGNVNDVRTAESTLQIFAVRASAELGRKRGEKSPGKTSKGLEVKLREQTAELEETSKALRTEVAERKRLEASLRESERQFALFVQHLPGAAWVKDVQGRYVYVNRVAEKIFRRTLKDLLGKTDEQVLPPDTAKQFKENDRIVMTSKQSLQTVEPIPQDDGPHYSLVSRFPILDPNGTLVLIGGVAVEITDKKEEARGQESESRRKDF